MNTTMNTENDCGVPITSEYIISGKDQTIRVNLSQIKKSSEV